MTDDLRPLLERIADSLERLAPSAAKPIDFEIADAFVWHADISWLEPIAAVSRVHINLLRGINRGLEFLKKNPDKVADAVIKKNKFGDPATVRTVVKQFAGVYSLGINREDIDSLIAATRIEAEAKKFGGADKFFTRQLLVNSGAVGR